MLTKNYNFLNYSEAAAILHIHPGTLRAWVMERKIEHIKIGGRVYFNPEIIDSFIKSSTIPARKTA